MVLKNFDPNENQENQKNNNAEIMSGALELSSDILSDMTDDSKENSAEVTDVAEEIENMTIQDVAADITDGAINFVGDIFNDIFSD